MCFPTSQRMVNLPPRPLYYMNNNAEIAGYPLQTGGESSKCLLSPLIAFSRTTDSSNKQCTASSSPHYNSTTAKKSFFIVLTLLRALARKATIRCPPSPQKIRYSAFKFRFVCSSDRVVVQALSSESPPMNFPSTRANRGRIYTVSGRATKSSSKATFTMGAVLRIRHILS